jgi:hypothetical protein
MGMAGRDHKIVVLVLHFSQFFGNAVGVVVVDKSDRADYDRIGLGGLLSDKTIADQVSKGLGPVGVTPPADGAVKPLQKVRIERNAYSA